MSDRSPWIHYFLSGARSKAEQRRVREYVQLGQQQEPGNGSSGFVHPTQQLQGVGAVESTQQQHIRLLKLERVMKAGSKVIDRSTMKKGKDVTSKPRESNVRRGKEGNTTAAEDSRGVGGLREVTPLIQSLLPPTLSREEFLQQGWLQEAVALQKKEKLKEAQDFLPYNHAVNPKSRVSTFKRRPKFQEEYYQERGGGAGTTGVQQKTKSRPMDVEAADAGRVATGKRMAQVRAWMLRQPKPEKGLLESNLHRLLVDRARKAPTPTATTTTTTMTDLTMTSTTDIEQSSGGGDARVHPSVGRRRSNNRYNNIDGSRTTDTSDSNNNQPRYYGDEDSESEEELPSPIRRFDDGDDVFSSTASDGGHGIVETTINNGDMKPPSSADAEGEEEEEEGDHYYQYSVTGPTRAIKTPQGGESNSRTHTTSRGGDRPHHHANRLSLPTTPSGSSGGGSGGGGAPKPPHAAGRPAAGVNAGASSLPGLKMSNIGGGPSGAFGSNSINYSGGDVPNATLPEARSTQMERTLQTTVTSLMGGTFAAQQRAIDETLPNLELLRRVRAKHLLPWYRCCSLRPIWFAELCEGLLATIPLVEYPSPSKFSSGGENTNNQDELGGSPFVLGATFGKTSNPSMNATNATSGGDAQSQVLLSGTMGGNTTLGGTTKTAGAGGGNNLGQVVFNVGCVDVSNAYFYHTYEGHIGMSEFAAAMFDFFLRLSPIRGGSSTSSFGGGSSTSGDGMLWIPHGRYIWVFTQILQRLYPGFNELEVIQLLAEWDAELQELHQERCLLDLIPRHWGLLHTEMKEESAARCTYAHFALVLTLLLEPWCLAKEEGEGGDTQEGGKPAKDDMSADRRGSPTHLLVSVVFPAVLQSVQHPKMRKTKNLSISNSSSPLPSLNVSAPLSATTGSPRYKVDQPQPRAASTSLVELRKMLMTPQQQQHGTRLLPSHKGAPRSQSTEPQPVRTSSVAKARIGLPDVFFSRRRPQRQE